ncbi:MAG TPA: GNAT family N-acetyltransferase [Marmoricola sp.]|nr:GNAT family N-acetyltransferase [Marmoricola sp.]
MPRTPVDIRDNPESSRVEAVLDGEVVGFSEYKARTDTVRSFLHTEVDDRMEGQGVGGQLVRGVMDVAREQGFKILPYCSFVRSYMRDHEDTHDVLAPGGRLEPDPEE